MKPRRQSRAPAQNLELLDSVVMSEMESLKPHAAVEVSGVTDAAGVGAEEPGEQAALRRDFGAIQEFIWAGDRRRVVVREKQAARDGGAHTYRAYEIVDGAASYRITTDMQADVYGRVDTRRPPRSFDPISEYSDGIDWLLAQQRNALDMIRELCPETIHVHGDAVFDGPGYITVLTRPETRYAAVLSAVVPA